MVNGRGEWWMEEGRSTPQDDWDSGFKIQDSKFKIQEGRQ